MVKIDLMTSNAVRKLVKERVREELKYVFGELEKIGRRVSKLEYGRKKYEEERRFAEDQF